MTKICIAAPLLKSCSYQLSFIYSQLFTKSLTTGHIPTSWKTSKIVPVPKSTKAKELNDFRPVALTSVPMKCLEKIVQHHLMSSCRPLLDSNQFAYKAHRGVEDAILVFTQNIYKHLDTPKAYVRTLFIDFSSAFNTIQPHLLVPKLQEMDIDPVILRWVLNYLTNRPQFVVIKNQNSTYTSSTMFTNTGAPQGTVLAPTLFSIYTNDCVSATNGTNLLKYADDTAIESFIKSEEDVSQYFRTIETFIEWCDRNYLQINVKKTKEMIFDFRKDPPVHKDVIIKNEIVERVKVYKYLGVTIDEKLDWTEHSSNVLNKMKTRLYMMRKLNSIMVDKNILAIFYRSCILSVLTFCLVAWGGNSKKSESLKIERILKNAHRMMGN